jgi:H/ACA ribonucleoprotein complex subunit 4
MKNEKSLLTFSLINIDKPAGPTSFSISEFVKLKLKLKKTSHMGTLDPKVTGVLPITLGRACKLADYFIKHDKTYVGVLHTHKDCKMNELQDLIDKNFSGKIKQIPPHRSAVKIAQRTREVFSFTFIEKLGKRDFLFETKVEGGTYIRKICSDLGEMIGGAHMGELRRTKAGIFSEKTMVSLPEFEAAAEKYFAGDKADLKNMIISAEDAIKQVLPVVNIEKRAVKSLHTGKSLFMDDVIGDIPDFNEGEKVAVFCKKDFIGIYRRTTEEIIFGRSEFVYN